MTDAPDGALDSDYSLNSPWAGLPSISPKTVPSKSVTSTSPGSVPTNLDALPSLASEGSMVICMGPTTFPSFVFDSLVANVSSLQATARGVNSSRRAEDQHRRFLCIVIDGEFGVLRTEVEHHSPIGSHSVGVIAGLSRLCRFRFVALRAATCHAYRN